MSDICVRRTTGALDADVSLNGVAMDTAGTFAST
jgi:hypothetical protein